LCAVCAVICLSFFLSTSSLARKYFSRKLAGLDYCRLKKNRILVLGGGGKEWIILQFDIFSL
jgi:hypothetical protein